MSRSKVTPTMSKALIYLPEWRVVLCRECGYCLRPGRNVWVRHLRQQPHNQRGAVLKAMLDLLDSYDLWEPGF